MEVHRKCHIAVLVGTLVSTIFSMLNKSKDSEEYRIAYAYFVESETFKNLNVSEDDIVLTSYGKEISTCNDVRSTYFYLTFFIRGENYQIICHENEAGLYVCTECTQVK